MSPTDANFEPYSNCVPLIGLRVAVGTWSAEQSGLVDLPDSAEELVAVEGNKVEPAMFIAQVIGCSMEPLVPEGSIVSVDR